MQCFRYIAEHLSLTTASTSIGLQQYNDICFTCRLLPCAIKQHVYMLCLGSALYLNWRGHCMHRLTVSNFTVHCYSDYFRSIGSRQSLIYAADKIIGKDLHRNTLVRSTMSPTCLAADFSVLLIYRVGQKNCAKFFLQ